MISAEDLKNAQSEISEEELEGVAGGGCTVLINCVTEGAGGGWCTGVPWKS